MAPLTLMSAAQDVATAIARMDQADLAPVDPRFSFAATRAAYDAARASAPRYRAYDAIVEDPDGAEVVGGTVVLLDVDDARGRATDELTRVFGDDLLLVSERPANAQEIRAAERKAEDAKRPVAASLAEGWADICNGFGFGSVAA